jgi:hypothetical protein
LIAAAKTTSKTTATAKTKQETTRGTKKKSKTTNVNSNILSHVSLNQEPRFSRK